MSFLERLYDVQFWQWRYFFGYVLAELMKVTVFIFTPTYIVFRIVKTKGGQNMSKSGGCLCGTVRYTATVEPVASFICHCKTVKN